MDDYDDIQAKHLLLDRAPDSCSNGGTSDEQANVQPNPGSLASGIKIRSQREKQLIRDLPIMGVSLLPTLSLVSVLIPAVDQ